MIGRIRSSRCAAATVGQIAQTGTAEPVPAENQAHEAQSEPTSDLAALAEQDHRDADLLRTQARERRVEAGFVITAAAQEAERITAAAREQELAITAQATAADRQAAKLEERAQYRSHAAVVQANLRAAEAEAAALTEERDGLMGQLSVLAGQLEDLRMQRQDLATQHAEAAGRADIGRAAELRVQLAGLDDVVADLAGKRDEASGRVAVIGDGTGPGLLQDALSRADGHRGTLRRLLNVLDPDRLEAQADRLLASLRTIVQL